MALLGFNFDSYLANKKDQLNDTRYGRVDNWTTEAVLEMIGGEGNAQSYAETHKLENVSHNSYFDASQYLMFKTAQYNALANNASNGNPMYPGRTYTASDVLAELNRSGTSAWEHFSKHALDERVAASNNFDINKALAAAVAYNNANSVDDKTNWTVQDIIDSYTTFDEANGRDNHADRFFADILGGTKYGAVTNIAVDQKVPTGNEVGAYNVYTNTFAEGDGIYQPGEVIQDITFNASIDGTDIIGNSLANNFYAFGEKSLDNYHIVDGKGGYDKLYADVFGNDRTVLTPRVQNVEEVYFRAQVDTSSILNGGSGTHGANNQTDAYIDAERIDATTKYYASYESRADLTVEDVRHASNDTTIGMEHTDPGASFYLYYNPQYLRADDGTTQSSGAIRVTDLYNYVDQTTGNGNALYNNPMTGYTLHVNDVQYTINWGIFNHTTTDGDNPYVAGSAGNATSYQNLVNRIKAAIEANPELNNLLDVRMDNSYTQTGELADGTPASANGYDIIFFIKDGASGVINLDGENDGWIAEGTTWKPNSGILTNYVMGDNTTTCPLIQTYIVLDNVGKVQWYDINDNIPNNFTGPNSVTHDLCLPIDVIYGSNAGDMVVGSMAQRGGVERFDVTVREGSWLSGLASTNNVLRMVTVQSDTNHPYATLAIGDWDGVTDYIGNGGSISDMQWTDIATLLTAKDYNGGQFAGLIDVAVFDGQLNGGYQGNIMLAAEITAASYDKYLKDVDVHMNAINAGYTANAPMEGYSSAFTYRTGSGNDLINMTVDGAIAANNDFAMQIQTEGASSASGAGTNMMYGNAGQDTVVFRYKNMTHRESNDQKYLNNVKIETGAGDDLVIFYGGDANAANIGRGSVIVDAGTGNDFISVNQLEHSNGGTVGANGFTSNVWNAVWVLNAVNPQPGDTPTGTVGTSVAGAYLNNNVDTFAKYATVTNTTSVDVVVNFLGRQVKLSEISGINALTTVNGRVSTRDINDAIVTIIENDPVLKHIVRATEGNGDTLLVESQVAGDMYGVHGGYVANFNRLDTLDIYLEQAGGRINIEGYSNNSPLTGTTAITSSKQWGVDDAGNNFWGYNSVLESQAVVTSGTGNDVIDFGQNNGHSDTYVLTQNGGHNFIANFDFGTFTGGTTGNELEFYDRICLEGYSYNTKVSVMDATHNSSGEVTDIAGALANAANGLYFLHGTSVGGNDVYTVVEHNGGSNTFYEYIEFLGSNNIANSSGTGVLNNSNINGIVTDSEILDEEGSGGTITPPDPDPDPDPKPEYARGADGVIEVKFEQAANNGQGGLKFEGVEGLTGDGSERNPLDFSKGKYVLDLFAQYSNDASFGSTIGLQTSSEVNLWITGMSRDDAIFSYTPILGESALFNPRMLKDPNAAPNFSSLVCDGYITWKPTFETNGDYLTINIFLVDFDDKMLDLDADGNKIEVKNPLRDPDGIVDERISEGGTGVYTDEQIGSLLEAGYDQFSKDLRQEFIAIDSVEGVNRFGESIYAKWDTANNNEMPLFHYGAYNAADWA